MKKFLKLLALTLLICLSSSGVVHAQDLNAGIAPSPLRKDEPTLQQVNQIVTQKQTAIDDENDQIVQLFQKKQDLSQKLQDEQKTIDDLNQKIADKKAAAEVAKAQVRVLEDMFVHVTRYADGSAGNLYDAGQCTWYVKNRRPDLPNNLGNANTWYYMASSDGYNVGATPKKGAVGTTTRGYAGHVVYVEGVNPDGSITISEMNYSGPYSLRTRQADASEFLYIYEL